MPVNLVNSNKVQQQQQQQQQQHMYSHILKLQDFPAVVRDLNSKDQSKLQNYGSIKNYNSEFHAQKQSSGSLNFLDLDNSIIS